jgi:hypothetical protein
MAQGMNRTAWTHYLVAVAQSYHTNLDGMW